MMIAFFALKKYELCMVFVIYGDVYGYFHI